MGAVNEVVATPTSRRSPSSTRPTSHARARRPSACSKFAFNLADDGLVGQQVFAGEATRLAYMTDEASRAGTPSWKSATPTGPPTRTTSKAKDSSHP